MFRTLTYPSSGFRWCSFCRLKPHRSSNTQRTENKTTDVVIHQHSRKPLTMDVLMSETCWVHKKWNKIVSDIKLVFYSSTITMMQGPINIRYGKSVRVNSAQWKTPESTARRLGTVEDSVLQQAQRLTSMWRGQTNTPAVRNNSDSRTICSSPVFRRKPKISVNYKSCTSVRELISQHPFPKVGGTCSINNICGLLQAETQCCQGPECCVIDILRCLSHQL